MLRLLFTLSFCLFFWAGYSQFGTVGIIGSATDAGWDASTPMEQDADNPNIWTIQITLMDGAAKFRADDAWTINWGSTQFPIGTGELNGPDIPIIGGNYFVTFNSETGEYFFDYQDSNFGIIGDAIPLSNWARDIFMFQDADNENLYYITLELLPLKVKFRADSDWATNWGGSDFPSGVATLDGTDISIPNAGTYYITFNRETLEYSFEEEVAFTTIGLIGDATPGGWDNDTPMNRNPFNPELWELTVDMTAGSFKFRADTAWTLNWGGDAFPIGTAAVNGDNIPVNEDQAGTYLASFNTESLEYRFLEIIDYPVIGIIGSSTPAGFDEITPMEKDPDNSSLWSLRAVLTEGGLFFSVDNTFANEVWGGATFPSGTAVMDASIEIPVEAGEYRITFNSTTGDYNFVEIIEYNAVSLVGASGPFRMWPADGDMGASDFFLDKDASDGNIWTGNNIDLIDFDPDNDGGVKFRVDTAWATNWGSEDFPMGVGTPNGPNIQPVAGIYAVVFNSATGEYAFSPAVSTREEMLNPADVQLMPNPAKSMVTVRIDFPHFSGKTNIAVYDVSGKQVMNQNFDNYSDITLNVNSLLAGTYIVHIKNGQYYTAKQLSVVR